MAVYLSLMSIHGRKHITIDASVSLLSTITSALSISGMILRARSFGLDGFRACTESYLGELVEDGLSYAYINRSKSVIKDLIIFLDDRGIHRPHDITTEHNDAFIKSYYYLSPKGIASKLCILRRYYRFLYLNRHIQIHLAEKLPHACINGRMKIPTFGLMRKSKKSNQVQKE